MTPQERLDELAAGGSALAIGRMASGFAVMSSTQFLPGYCLLLAYPLVPSLNDLAGAGRDEFLRDMGALGDAVLAETGAVRINYAIYGNLDPFLHAHVIPRFVDEDEQYRTGPPFLYPPNVRDSAEHAYDASRHGGLVAGIRRKLIESGYNLG